MTSTGVVVSFDPDHGFGFIRSRSFDEDVFVHARAVEGGRLLRAGQRVTFAAEPSERGPRAVHVEPGKRIIPLAPDLAAATFLGLLLVTTTLLLRFAANWPWVLSWPVAINPLTFALFALDKHRATLGSRRISERTLLFLSLLGGTPAALLAMPLLRHKTRKRSFRLAFAVVVVVQVAALAGAWWLWGR